MITDCPACGEPLERQEDRIYQDWCGFCGWATSERRAADRLNAAIIQYLKLRSRVAGVLFEEQQKYDNFCGYLSEVTSWESLDEDERKRWYTKAETVLESRESVMRERLIFLRQLQRAERNATTKKPKAKRKRACDLSLNDSIIMPSGIPYEIRELSWAGGYIQIEAAVPDTGNARVEYISTPWNRKFEVA